MDRGFQLRRQLTTQFPEQHQLFASPIRIELLTYSYTGVWREWQTAAEAAEIARPGTHSVRHSRLDQVGTQLTVQRNEMCHSDFRTTMIYGDVVDGRIGPALEKVSGPFANNTRTARGEP